jgi:hydroxypyruvate reductase
MISLLDGASEADQVIVLLSGGGSSLLGLPLGLTRPEYQELFRVLLTSGAEIGEMNVLRRRFGALAGGRLAARAAPASVTALVVSDVVGDTLHDIASGPTCPDPSSDAKVLALLQRYAPGLSMARELVAQGEPPRAPSRADPLWARVENHIVVSNSIALLAAQRVLERAGWPTLLLSAEVTGEAREAAAEHAAFVREVLSGRTPLRPPLAIISGGETTVSMPEPPSALRRTALRQTGRGGRNSEFALALALALGPEVPIWALIADSDGIDGVGGHAGAFLTPELFVRLSPREAAVALESHDSLSLFEAAKHDFVTGPTGTNVNDLRILLIAGEGGEVG